MHPIDLKEAIARELSIPVYEVESILARLAPVIQVGDLAASDQAVDRACATGISQPGAAAQYSQIQLLNPVGSGVLARAHGIHFVLESVQELVFGFYDTALPTDEECRYLDRRLRPNTPACTVHRDDGASKVVGAATQFYYTNRSSGQIPIDPPVILQPGNGLVVECLTVDVNLYASIFWTERPQRPED